MPTPKPFSRRGRRSIACVRPLLLLCVLATGGRAFAQDAPDGAAWTPVWEHWYTLELAGATAGWMRETVSSDGARYRTEGASMLKISRGGIEIEVGMDSTFVETHDGRPLELRFSRDMGVQSVESRWEFRDDHVRTVSRQGDRTIEQEHPLPTETWLPPMAAHRYVEERRRAGATSVTFRTVDGQSGLEPLVITQERAGEGQVEHDGRSLPVTVWRTTSSALPGTVATSHVSSDGHLLLEEVDLPFGTLRTRVATKADALAAGRGPAPELLVNSFVRVEPPIARPRDAVASTLRLRASEGKLPDLPSAGAQRVEPAPDGRTALLRLDIDDNVPAPLSDAERAECLASSATIDAGHPLIVKLAASARRGVSDDPAARAEALRRFVHRYISAKSLDTAFATASETARTRGGDCSEHGVLLCAMLRADGIPARVATGLVYAEEFAGERNIFGWHMWTQAYLDGRWVDHDATLPTRFDAAHVLTGTSTLSETVGSTDLAAIVMLIGNLEIEVVDVRHGSD